MRRPTFLPAFLLCSAALASPALGADPPAAKPAQADRTSDPVVTLFAQAQTAFAKGDIPGAYKAYLEAWALQKSYDIAGNLGNVEMKLGKPRDAAEHLAYASNNFPPTGDPALKEALKKKLGEAEDQVARMRVSVTQEGASIWVNGKLVGVSPLRETLYLEPGEVTVEVKLSGYKDERRAVRIDRGRGELVGVQLMAVPAPVLPPPSGGVAPVVVPQKRSPVPAIVVGGLAVGGLAVGTGLTVAANGKSSTADTLRTKVGSNSACAGAAARSTDCTALMSNLKSRDSFTKGAFASFVVGGAFVLATAGLGVWSATRPRDQKAAHAIRVAPVVGRGEGGLVVGGSW